MRLYQNSAQFYWINHQINPLHTMPGTSIPAEAFVSFSSYKQSINTSGLPSDHHYQTLQRPKRFLPNSRKVLPFFPVSLDSTKSHYKNGMILPSYCTLRKGHKSLPIDPRNFIRNDNLSTALRGTIRNGLRLNFNIIIYDYIIILETFTSIFFKNEFESLKR